MAEADDYAEVRETMVRRQLQTRGINAPRVLAAMTKIPRHRFVPNIPPAEAYADRAWPIECGQTISQPYIVGLMTQSLQLTGSERVLEIGTGSGYQAAVLAELAGHVITVERHAQLAAGAERVLKSLGYENVEVHVADGSLGRAEDAPFERIIVTAAAAKPPPSLLAQLSDGGLLVMPVGGADAQQLESIRRQGDTFLVQPLTPCRFVPLIGLQGMPDAGNSEDA